MAISSVSGYSTWYTNNLLAKANISYSNKSTSSAEGTQNVQGNQKRPPGPPPAMQGAGLPPMAQGKSMAEMKQMRDLEAKIMDGTATEEETQEVMQNLQEMLANRPDISQLPEDLQAAMAEDETFQKIQALETKVIDGSATLEDLQSLIASRPGYGESTVEDGNNAFQGLNGPQGPPPMGPPPGPPPGAGGVGQSETSEEDQIKTLLDYLTEEDETTGTSLLDYLSDDSDAASTASGGSSNQWAKQWLESVVKAYSQNYDYSALQSSTLGIDA